MDPSKLKQIIEAAILASGIPLTIDQLLRLFENHPPERSEIKLALAAISDDCVDRGFELQEVSSGYRFQVREEFGQWVHRLWEDKPPRYSRALLETLSLVAYRQPITRGDIEEIRGVSVSTNIMRSLLEREWVRIVGHRDVPGRPAMYATTKAFLDYFNLKSLDELPTLAEIRDLDKINAELDLQEIPQPEESELNVASAAADETSDAVALQSDFHAVIEEEDEFPEDLDEIHRKVTDIEENIRTFLHPVEEDDIDPSSSADGSQP